MQGQVTELAENMRQKDLMIEDLKQKLRDQIAYACKLKTLSNMDLDNARMSLRDPADDVEEWGHRAEKEDEQLRTWMH